MDITNIDFDTTCITITCGADVVKLYAIGECCSYSYFHDSCQEQISSLVGVKFISMTHSDDEIDESSLDIEILGEGCIQVTKYNIKTSIGDIPLILINDSNGYYSGWVDMHINGKNESRKIE